MKIRVCVLGGGIGGMTAAHELARRGYEVEVYEKLSAAGGKARSIPVPGTGTDGRRDLPGEHGFRFFPGFYRHLPATMAEIPFGSPADNTTVFNNLVDTKITQLARYDAKALRLLDGLPKSLADVKLIMENFGLKLGLQAGEGSFFGARLWQVMTSCRERREDESTGLESLSWWEYMKGPEKSPAFQKIFIEGLSRSLVAARAKEASARTIGQVQVHLLHDILDPTETVDRVLRGPTSEVFIDPWLDYLRGLGVSYQVDCTVTALNLKDGRIQSAEIASGSQKREVTADWFVAALPVEDLAPLITPDFVAVDPGLAQLSILAKEVRWMNGLQFYLNKDVSVNNGHTLYVNSPWALTSISQAQFWDGINIPTTYGDGKVRGILSVDVSDWDTPGTFNGKKATECSAEEIKDEAWAQIKRSLNVDGQTVLTDDLIVDWFLDPAITPADKTPDGKASNTEPLFINMPRSWSRRPNPQTKVHNLLLAADYVRTRTDLACMEAAAEAAKLATNSILVQSKRTDFCKIFPMNMPTWLAPARAADKLLYDMGLPWGWPLDDTFD